MGRHTHPQPPQPPALSTSIIEHFANLDNWIVSTWGAPMGGQFQADHVKIVPLDGLVLKLSQNFRSIGGEVQFKVLLGYGIYTWIARMGSTAVTPIGSGHAISGGVSGLFPYNANSETELDFEAQGQFPNQLDVTTWHTLAASEETDILAPSIAEAFHAYKMIWKAGRVDYYVDLNLRATHLKNVPSKPAYPMINHWGTDTAAFGGLATPGIDRYLYVQQFSYAAL